MVSDESTRKMVKELRDAGFTTGTTKGSHTPYTCPCGAHTVVVPDGHRMQSPGLVRQIRNTIKAHKEGK